MTILGIIILVIILWFFSCCATAFLLGYDDIDVGTKEEVVIIICFGPMLTFLLFIINAVKLINTYFLRPLAYFFKNNPLWSFALPIIQSISQAGYNFRNKNK